MKIRCFNTGFLNANSYVIYPKRGEDCIVIDPGSPEILLCFLKKHSLSPKYIFVTHEHFDHMIGANNLRDAFPNCKLIASKTASDRFCLDKANLFRYSAQLYAQDPFWKTKQTTTQEICRSAEIVFQHTYELHWRNECFLFTCAPGHSPGSILIEWKDKGLFTGDSWIYGKPLLTKLPDGSKKTFLIETKPLLEKIIYGTKVFAGHGPTFHYRKWNRKSFPPFHAITQPEKGA